MQIVYAVSPIRTKGDHLAFSVDTGVGTTGAYDPHELLRKLF